MFNRIILSLVIFLITNIAIAGVELIPLKAGDRISDPSAKPQLQQYFASWCGSCSEVMQTMLAVKNAPWAYKIISVDETIDLAQDYFKKKPQLSDAYAISYWDKNAELATKMKVTAMPCLILLDSKGVEVMRLVGHPSQEQVKAMIEKAK